MPQVWLTYEDFGDAFRLSPDDARNLAIEGCYSRRRCSDGLTRVKLTPVLLAAFLRKVVLTAMERQDVTIDQRATETHRSDMAREMDRTLSATLQPDARYGYELR